MSEREIFIAALQRDDPVDRRAFLDEACAKQPKLRRAVEGLLHVYEKAGSFLQHPAVDSAATGPFQEAAELTTLPESPGTLIGPYKLLEQIGEGGMGVVYVSEQTEPVRRRVALKIIKPGMDTKQVIARFEAERQALAMMDHPHIAKVLDAGTTDAGRPYFVMELVRGLPITEYCDKARLSPRQRLELFVDVCHAVQHAHQKGVIHRDLKPSNVMITVHDGRPVAKVIDFGVAKAVGQQLTERTVYTAHTQLVGTPLYMSPEQADFSSQDVDTRSDVYSLGVLLYELLTGQTPFDKETLTKAGFDEMRRIIREDEPPSPSRRFSTLSAQAISTVSQHRSVDERHLGHILRGELDWIVMKALEKDRSRRYESASALAADIQRYLSDEPVLACPPTTMYRFQKFARKHKPALATAAAIATCLILGTTVSAWQAARATQAEAQATANEQKAVANEQKAVANEQRANANADAAEQKEQEAVKQRDEVKALADKLAAKERQLQRTLYASNMNLAQHAWDAGMLWRVNELLEQHGPKSGEFDHRGFEWHYLYKLCHPERLTFKGDIVAFSPDGKCLASASDEKTVNVWDAQTGQQLLVFKGHTDGVRSVAFSPDGKRLASTSGIWDTTKKAYAAGELTVWDAQTAQELFSIKGHTDAVWSVAFSPDGKRLATTSGIWDTTKKAYAAGELKVWDAQTAQELLSIKGHTDAVSSVAFSPDGKRLASGSWDKTAKVWDAETGQELLTFQGHSGQVRGVAYSPDGTRLVSAATDGTVRVWDLTTSPEARTFRQFADNVASFTFSPDGKRLATGIGGWDTNEKTTIAEELKVWNAVTGQELLALKGAARIPVFSPDGKRLAGASGAARVWDAETGQELLTFKGHTGVYSVVFSPDGKRLASAGYEGTVKVWDAGTGQELSALKGHTDKVWSVAFSPDGKRLATASVGPWGGQSGELKVWDAQTGQELLSLQGRNAGSPCNVAFSPDGKRLASGINFSPGEAGVVQVWNAQTGDKLLTLQGHTHVVRSVAFSPDGNRLASGSGQGSNKHPVENQPGETKVWDAETGQELLTFNGSSFYHCVAFSPNGHRLASNAGGPVTIYDATPLPEKP